MIADDILTYKLADPQQMAARRLKTYGKIAERCQSLRNLYGNCAITWAYISANIHPMRIDEIYIHSQAEFGVLNHAS